MSFRPRADHTNSVQQSGVKMRAFRTPQLIGTDPDPSCPEYNGLLEALQTSRFFPHGFVSPSPSPENIQDYIDEILRKRDEEKKGWEQKRNRIIQFFNSLTPEQLKVNITIPVQRGLSEGLCDGEKEVTVKEAIAQYQIIHNEMATGGRDVIEWKNLDTDGAQRLWSYLDYRFSD